MRKVDYIQSLKAQSGFSLTEVMVGGAILAGVAVAGATLFKNQSDSQKKINADQLVSMYHSTVTKVLQNTRHCNATFREFYGEPISNEVNISSIRICQEGRCQTASVQNEDMQPDPFIEVGSFIEGFNETGRKYWKLKQIITRNALKSNGVLKLEFEYLDIRDGRMVSKDALVNMKFDGEVFSGCFSDQESISENLAKQFCESDGIMSFLQWNENDEKCQLKDSGPLSDCTNNRAGGIQDEGTLDCSTNLTAGWAPSTDNVLSSENFDCSSSGQANLLWEGGKLKIKCSGAPSPSGGSSVATSPVPEVIDSPGSTVISTPPTTVPEVIDSPNVATESTGSTVTSGPGGEALINDPGYVEVGSGGAVPPKVVDGSTILTETPIKGGGGVTTGTGTTTGGSAETGGGLSGPVDATANDPINGGSNVFEAENTTGQQGSIDDPGSYSQTGLGGGALNDPSFQSGFPP
jgi:type II secretory pathway pseudopilin PulG